MKTGMNPFIKSSVRYVIATVLGQSVSFLGIVVFTRIMPQRDYGMYSTYYAYVSILTVFTGANLYFSINNAYIDHKSRIQEFRKTILVLSTLTCAVVMVAACIICGMVDNTADLRIVVLAAVHGYAFFVVNYRSYSANMENDYKKKQWLLILPYFLQFLFSVLFVLALPEDAFTARAAGSVLGIACCAGAVYIEMMRCKGKLVLYSDWKYALSISLPSIVMSLSYMLMQQCDKVMISAVCGSDATAVYSVIYYFGYAITAVNQAVSAVRQVWIYHRLDEHNIQGVQTIQKWYLVMAAFMVSCILMAAPEIIRLIMPDAYWQFEYVMPFVIGSGMMVIYGFYTEAAMFYKQNAFLSAAVLVSALINIGLNWMFMPEFGPAAAAYTTVAAYTVLFIFSALIVRAKIKGLYSIKVFLRFILYLYVSGFVYNAVYANVLARYLFFGCMMSAMLGYVIVKRNEWKGLFGEQRRQV